MRTPGTAQDSGVPLLCEQCGEPTSAHCWHSSGTHPSFQDASGAQPAAIPAVDMVPAQLLDGGEIVILAIKPSLWFIVFVSARWLAAMAAVIFLAGTARGWVPVHNELVAQAALTVAAVRVGVALLQWVSRLYVLTNRRIMRLTGILNIDLFECQLTKIQSTTLNLTWYERITGTGTISFTTAGGAGGPEASWTHVSNPLELHERVRAAINRARTPGGI